MMSFHMASKFTGHITECPDVHKTRSQGSHANWDHSMHEYGVADEDLWVEMSTKLNLMLNKSYAIKHYGKTV